MEQCSCLPRSAYGESHLCGDVVANLGGRESSCLEAIETLFPAFEYERDQPLNARSDDDAFLASLEASNQAINASFCKGPRSILVEIPTASILQNVIYSTVDTCTKLVYETYRPNDRPYTSLADEVRIQVSATIIDANSRKFLYLGSVGSFNYGHWLIDDLPRLEAFFSIRKRFPDRQIVITVPGYFEALNNVITASINMFLKGYENYTIFFIAPDVVYTFESIFFCSPVSYHPMLKSPDALANLVATLPLGNPRSRQPIFVDRRTNRSRALTNIDLIRFRLEMKGFRSVDPEGMSFAEQRDAFRHASMVVGCMGAAMTNTVFCEPGTQLVYLAPNGWLEPFYWDLAAVRGHSYHVCFGSTSDLAVPPHMSSYNVAWPMIDAVLEMIGPH